MIWRGKTVLPEWRGVLRMLGCEGVRDEIGYKDASLVKTKLSSRCRPSKVLFVEKNYQHPVNCQIYFFCFQKKNYDEDSFFI